MAWQTKTGDSKAHRHEPQLNVLIQGLLNPVTLLDMIRHFVVFESSKIEDKNGIITISNIKKMAVYHQYDAVNKAVLSTIRAANDNSIKNEWQEKSPINPPLNIINSKETIKNTIGNKKAGVILHTQGSGKSLSMVFYTGKIVLAMNNPTVVILTDRNDLDDQLFAIFSASVQLLRQTPKQAENRAELKELLKVNSGGVIFATIQKFQPEDGSNVYNTLSNRHPTSTRKMAKAEAIISNPDRIKTVAADIVQHFEQRLIANANQDKGMIVTMSRQIAVDLYQYQQIIALRLDWHSDDLRDGVIKVIMTSSAADGAALAKHHTTKQDRQILANRMKDNDDKLKLVIVRDIWLTGFDAPSMHTLYIDKSMKGHNLMQAIARVNRVYKDKAGGLAVDYLGIAAELKEALSFYSEAGGRGEPALVQDEAIALMQEKIQVLDGIMHGYDYHRYFTADTAQKLKIILESEDFILGIDQGERKPRFIRAVSSLSQSFALAVPHLLPWKTQPL